MADTDTKDKTTPITGPSAGTTAAPVTRETATDYVAINKNGKRVPADSPEAVTQVAAPGQPIPTDEELARFGTRTGVDERADTTDAKKAAAAKKGDSADGDKAAPKSEDKAVAQGEDKSAKKAAPKKR